MSLEMSLAANTSGLGVRHLERALTVQQHPIAILSERFSAEAAQTLLRLLKIVRFDGLADELLSPCEYGLHSTVLLRVL